MAPESDTFSVSTDPALLDVDFICTLLAGAYWASSRPRPVIEASLKSSICFGAYETKSGRQVGFSRIVTDGCTFSWLCDVIVDPAFRGRGVGKLLMDSVSAHLVVARTSCILATRDAHSLYERHGFIRVEAMRRKALVPA
jgi:GNAT superfamily N-acetyltransferase